MFNNLKQKVLKANQELPHHKLVKFTWGNVSAISKDQNHILIKPSGVPYKKMKKDDIVVTNMKGEVIEGKLKPSVDTYTHIEIYKAFKNVKSIVHTHSTFATIFAQANKPIPCLGTTHCDYFFGNIPITRNLKEDEVKKNYEANTGKVIAEFFKTSKFSYNQMPSILVPNHGPFCWGNTTEEAVLHAVVLEEIAKMALHTLQISPDTKIPDYLINKHFLRKHGENANYGQK